MTFDDLVTPCLLLDRDRMTANVKAMAARMDRLGGTLRPHVKTHKSIDVWRAVQEHGTVIGATVSTLAEAATFFEHGVVDILYGVGISPNKCAAAADLVKRGCKLTVTLDSVEMAHALADAGSAFGVTYPVLIELDVDGHRAGVDPSGPELIEIADILTGSDCTVLKGVMTHAGESYACVTPESLLHAAHTERDLTVAAAERLRAAGYPCPEVSIGSTPTACVIDDLTGVTEVRPGVYTFFDLVMRGVGVCRMDDIALSVLTTVIGHQKARGWILTDAGWMALSRDLGTASQAVSYGYGQVCDISGQPMDGLIVSKGNQEHGILAMRDGSMPDLEAFPIGTKLRILPNHACATAAQHSHYHVLEGGRLTQSWPRCQGWAAA